MATSKKVTELTAITTVANSDLMYVVHDPAGVPASNKITVQDLFKRVVSIGAAPANNASSGTQGQMVANGSFLYVCVASNTWIRVAATTSW